MPLSICPSALLIFLAVCQSARESQSITVHSVAFSLPPRPPMTGSLASNSLLYDAERLHDKGISPPQSYVTLQDEVYAVTKDSLVVNVGGCRPVTVADLKPNGCRNIFQCGALTSIRVGPLGQLLVVDAFRGLFQLHPITGTVRRLYDSSTLVNGRPSVYLNDALVLPDGTILMSDSSRRFGLKDEFWIRFEGRADGRLLALDPRSGNVTEVMNGLAYPNGLELAHNAKSVLVAETGRARIIRLDLMKRNTFHRSVFKDNLPGMPENIRKSDRGTYWAALTYPRFAGSLSPFDEYSLHPSSRDILAELRSKEELERMMSHRGLAVELSQRGDILSSLHDSTGRKVNHVTEVMAKGGVIYVGSRDQDAVIRVVLPDNARHPMDQKTKLQLLYSRCLISKTQYRIAVKRLEVMNAFIGQPWRIIHKEPHSTQERIAPWPGHHDNAQIHPHPMTYRGQPPLKGSQQFKSNNHLIPTGPTRTLEMMSNAATHWTPTVSQNLLKENGHHYDKQGQRQIYEILNVGIDQRHNVDHQIKPAHGRIVGSTHQTETHHNTPVFRGHNFPIDSQHVNTGPLEMSESQHHIIYPSEMTLRNHKTQQPHKPDMSPSQFFPTDPNNFTLDKYNVYDTENLSVSSMNHQAPPDGTPIPTLLKSSSPSTIQHPKTAHTARHSSLNPAQINNGHTTSGPSLLPTMSTSYIKVPNPKPTSQTQNSSTIFYNKNIQHGNLDHDNSLHTHRRTVTNIDNELSNAHQDFKALHLRPKSTASQFNVQSNPMPADIVNRPAEITLPLFAINLEASALTTPNIPFRHSQSSNNNNNNSSPIPQPTTVNYSESSNDTTHKKHVTSQHTNLTVNIFDSDVQNTSTYSLVSKLNAHHQRELNDSSRMALEFSSTDPDKIKTASLGHESRAKRQVIGIGNDTLFSMLQSRPRSPHMNTPSQSDSPVKQQYTPLTQLKKTLTQLRTHPERHFNPEIEPDSLIALRKRLEQLATHIQRFGPRPSTPARADVDHQHLQIIKKMLILIKQRQNQSQNSTRDIARQLYSLVPELKKNQLFSGSLDVRNVKVAQKDSESTKPPSLYHQLLMTSGANGNSPPFQTQRSKGPTSTNIATASAPKYTKIVPNTGRLVKVPAHPLFIQSILLKRLQAVLKSKAG